MEVACENNSKCDYDQRAFKAIATRSFARAALAAPIIADPIHAMINASAKAAAESCEGSSDSVASVACKLAWSSSSKNTLKQKSADDGNLGEVLNALSAIQALLWPSVNLTNSAIEPTKSNATTDGSSPGPSGAPQNTGAGSTLAASFTLVLAIAFAAALSC